MDEGLRWGAEHRGWINKSVKNKVEKEQPGPGKGLGGKPSWSGTGICTSCMADKAGKLPGGVAVL